MPEELQCVQLSVFAAGRSPPKSGVLKQPPLVSFMILCLGTWGWGQLGSSPGVSWTHS